MMCYFASVSLWLSLAWIFIAGASRSLEERHISETKKFGIKSNPDESFVYQVYTLAGNGAVGMSSDNSVASASSLNSPAGIFVDSVGDYLYFVDSNNQRARKVNIASGISEFFAGTGEITTTSEGSQATSTSLSSPFGIIATSLGVSYVSEIGIRKIATNGIMTKYAGMGSAVSAPYGDGGPATSAVLDTPLYMALDSSNNLYVADMNHAKIRKIAFLSGIISTFVGTGSAESSGDWGYASAASLNQPKGLFIASAGGMYITDYAGHLIRYIGTDGKIYRFAGDETNYIAENVDPMMTGMFNPSGIWGNTVGDIFYCDTSFTLVRRFSATTGLVNTIASFMGMSDMFVPSSMATDIVFQGLEGIFGDASGRIFFSDNYGDVGGNTVRVLLTVPQYEMFTLVGTGVAGSADDGAVASISSVSTPTSIFIDTATHSLYFSDNGNNRVRKINLSDVQQLCAVFAGTGVNNGLGDGGRATSASFRSLAGVVGDSSGVVYVSDTSDFRIRKIDTDSIITSYVGSGVNSENRLLPNGDGGPATSATMDGNIFIALDTANNIYIADGGNNRIRKVDAVSKIITTVAGNGDNIGEFGGLTASVTQDATSAYLNSPLGVFVNTANEVYITEFAGNRVRLLTQSDSQMSLFAGSEVMTTPEENVAATASGVLGPSGIWGNTVGDIYFSDMSNYVLRVVNAHTRIVTTIAGNGASEPFDFESEGLALAIAVMPMGVWGDSASNLFVADPNTYVGGNVIRGVYAGPTRPIYTMATATPTATPSIPTMQPSVSLAPSAAPTLPVYQISTVVGTGVYGTATEGVPATSSSMRTPNGLWIDTQSTLILTSQTLYKVFSVSLMSNIITTLAGQGFGGVSGDSGPATSAKFAALHGVCSVTSGATFVSDSNDHRIRKIGTDGIIESYAGQSGEGGTATAANGEGGPASSALLNVPRFITVSPLTNALYFAEHGTNRVRKIELSTQIITTVVGTGIGGPGCNNCAATSNDLSAPFGVFVSSTGSVYFTETSNNAVKMMDTSNIVHLFAGGIDTSENAIASSAQIVEPSGIWGNTVGDIYLASSGSIARLTVVSAFSGRMNTVAGGRNSATAAFIASGPALDAVLISPRGVTVDSSGHIYVASSGSAIGGNNVRVVYASTASPTTTPSVAPSAAPTLPVYQISTVVGTGVSATATEGVPATSSAVNTPGGLSLDNQHNNLLFVSQLSYKVYKVSLANNILLSLAGQGLVGSTGDNEPATSAKFNNLYGICVITSGAVLVSDIGDHRIRKIDTDGIITSFAGVSGQPAVVATATNGDGGSASSATLNNPRLMAVGPDNSVYVAEYTSNKVRRIDTGTSIISKVVGTGAASTGCNNCPASSASLSAPIGVFVNSVGWLYYTESNNNRIRVVDSNQIVKSFASGADTSENAVATTAQISSPGGIWGNTMGDIYVLTAINTNPRLKIISAFSGRVSTIAGQGASTSAFIASGPALDIVLVATRGVTVDSSGLIYVASSGTGTGGSNIRVVFVSTASPTTTPTTALPSVSPSVAPSAAPTLPVYQISTVVGNGVAGVATEDGAASSSPMKSPYGVCIDSQQTNLLFVSSGNYRAYKVSLVNNIITTIAGQDVSGVAGDNQPATSAQFSNLYGICTLTSGAVFVSDSTDQRIRKIGTDGIITHFAGTSLLSNAGTSANGDGGPASSAMFYSPRFMAISPSNSLYVSEFINHRVRRIDLNTNIITTAIGNGATTPSCVDCAGTSGAINGPFGVFVSSTGVLYATDFSDNRIKTMDTNNIVTTFASGTDTSENAVATTAQMLSPAGIWGNTMGDIYVLTAINTNPRLKVISAFSGRVRTIAGQGASTSAFIASGPALDIVLVTPRGMTVDSGGRIYVSSTGTGTGGNNVRMVYASTASPTATPTVSIQPSLVPTVSEQPTLSPSISAAPTVPVYQMYTVAGNGVASSFANGAVNGVYGIFVNSAGTLLYFADSGNRSFRKVDLVSSAGFIVAGATSPSGSSGDGGQATSATFTSPRGIVVSTSGAVFVDDASAHYVRKIATDGIITTSVGDGTPGAATASNGDGGPASSASLNLPNLMALDSNNNLYIAVTNSHKVRRVDAVSQIISTIAGTGNSADNGDGMFATSANINLPNAVFVDSLGNVFVADQRNKIRVIGGDNIFRGLVGTGAMPAVENVPASATGMSIPRGVWVNTVGDIYFTDGNNRKLRVVSAHSGLVNTIASNGDSSATSFVSSGPALSIPILTPRGVWGDLSGKVMVSDFASAMGGSAIRALYASTESPTATPSISQTPTATPSTQAPSTPPTLPIYHMYTVTGTGSVGSAVAGAVASSSKINTPKQMFLQNSDENFLFFADSGNLRVRKVTLTGNGNSAVFAGVGTSGSSGDGGQATSAQFIDLEGVCQSITLAVFVSDSSINKVKKVDPSGIINVFVGSGTTSTDPAALNGDGGAATSATLNGLRHIAVDSAANLYICDPYNSKVRKVDATTQVISTVIGTGVPTSGGNGFAASSATVNLPYGIFVNSVGVLYMSEYGGKVVRVVGADNVIRLFAGMGDPVVPVEESVPATATSFAPFGIWGNTMGDIYISDNANFLLRVVSSFSGLIVTIAGNGDGIAASFQPSGWAKLIPLLAPMSVTGDSTGHIYVADASGDTGGNNIRGLYTDTEAPTASPTAPTISPTVIPSAVPTSATPSRTPTVCPSGTPSVAPSQLPSVTPTTSPSSSPTIVPSISPTRVPTVVPSVSPTVLPTICPSATPSVTPSITPTITPSVTPSITPTIIPSVTPSIAPTITPSVSPSIAPTITPSVTPSRQPTITPSVTPSRQPTITPSVTPSVVPSVMPSVSPSISPSVAPSIVPTATPSQIPTMTPSMTPSVSPSITPSTLPSTMPSCKPTAVPSNAPTLPAYYMYTAVGNGAFGLAADGAVATSTSMATPQQIAVDITNTYLYVAESTAYAVRKVNLQTGISYKFAGDVSGFALQIGGDNGNGGQATSAKFTMPMGVCLSNLNVAYVSDSNNQKVRRIGNDGIITTYVGMGASSMAPTDPNGDGGPATSATLFDMRYIAMDSGRNLFIADTYSHKVRRVDTTTKMITTVVGTGGQSGNGDGGFATSATLSCPYAVFVDSVGKMFVSEYLGNRIRIVDAANIIHLLAGGGTSGVQNGAVASSAQVSSPFGIWGNSVGDIFFAENGASLLRMISTFSGRVYTIGGSGANNVGTFVKSGSAQSIPLLLPAGVSVDINGQVLVSDSSGATGGSAVRALIDNVLAPTFVPSAQPTLVPTYALSASPTVTPSSTPTTAPSDFPSCAPSGTPSKTPTALPSITPSATPSVSPSATPSIVPSATPSVSPSATPSIVPSATPSVTPSALPSITPSVNPSVAPSAAPSITPSATPSIAPSAAPSIVPSATPSVTPSATPSATPSVAPSAAPSITPSITPSYPPSITPSALPSITPSATPSVAPSAAPSITPSATPSVAPSVTPSITPSYTPSITPSALPSITPSATPSFYPSVTPSITPSATPSVAPSVTPSITPSSAPSFTPSATPSITSSVTPSSTPSFLPSIEPSIAPTEVPSAIPSITPSDTPSVTPSATPSIIPSVEPSVTPSATPSITPSVEPSVTPSATPSITPSVKPSVIPSATPSITPSVEPSITPSATPSITPSVEPSVTPSAMPSITPSVEPLVTPSTTPSITPSTTPSSVPSSIPTTTPSESPSIVPSVIPSEVPSALPSFGPSASPSVLPSVSPSSALSAAPSVAPSSVPSFIPSDRPTFFPSLSPSEAPSIVPSIPPSITPNNPMMPGDTPSAVPSVVPSEIPSLLPSTIPSYIPDPSILPTMQPSSTLSSTPPSMSPNIMLSDAPSAASVSPTMPPSLLPSATPNWSSSSTPGIAPTITPSVAPSIVSSTATPSFTPSMVSTTQASATPSATPSKVPSPIPTPGPSKVPTETPTIQPSVTPSTSPSTQPSSQPSGQPSSQPTKYSNFPTYSPTRLTRGTFPSNHSISVLIVSHWHGFIPSFKIVLPFLRVTTSANSLAFNGFYDVSLNLTASVGTSTVLYGNISSHKVDIRALSLGKGFAMSPAVSYDYSGRSVSNAGDINGDGYDDLIIGVPYAARCYVLFGTPQGFVNMTQGFTIFGQADSMTGWSVSGAGDVNNDTFADIIIGAPYSRNGVLTSGAAFVLYGKRSGFRDVSVAALLPEQGFVVFGAAEGDTLGVSVSGTGDVNGDGYDDIVIGALKSSSLYRGGAYVVYGWKEPRGTLYLSALKPQEGVTMVGPVWSYSGYSVSGAGDVNGDGFDDLLIGSVPFRTIFGAQVAYLVYGNNKTESASLDLSTLNKQQGVVISGGGVVVSGAEDIDHDGFDDILIGSNYGFNGAGFVVILNITNQVVTAAPSSPPTLKPSTLHPTLRPTKLPSTRPSRAPSPAPTTKTPTLRPSLRPTVLQSGPSQPPTEAPTGPTSTPSSVPTVSTSQPSSCPTTSFPSSRPTSLPSSRPSSAPTSKPSAHPTKTSSTPTIDTATPSIAASTSPLRTRNPVVISPTYKPTRPPTRRVVHIVEGGEYEKIEETSTNYVIDAWEAVHITGHGSSEGDIYTVLPQVNGSLHIEIFNNISDKLSLTSHSTIHAMSDLVITSGSVIVTFPTSGQRIRLANLTPLDISENNFIFAPPHTVSTDPTTVSQTVVFIVGGVIVGCVALLLLYCVYSRQRQLKMFEKSKFDNKIALEDNPTRLIIAVNDMYAHFDAYIPAAAHTSKDNINNSKNNGGGINKNHNISSSSIGDEEKSNEPSPLTSFEQQINTIVGRNTPFKPSGSTNSHNSNVPFKHSGSTSSNNSKNSLVKSGSNIPLPGSGNVVIDSTHSYLSYNSSLDRSSHRSSDSHDTASSAPQPSVSSAERRNHRSDIENCTEISVRIHGSSSIGSASSTRSSNNISGVSTDSLATHAVVNTCDSQNNNTSNFTWRSTQNDRHSADNLLHSDSESESISVVESDFEQFEISSDSQEEV